MCCVVAMTAAPPSLNIVAVGARPRLDLAMVSEEPSSPPKKRRTRSKTCSGTTDGTEAVETAPAEVLVGCGS